MHFTIAPSQSQSLGRESICSIAIDNSSTEKQSSPNLSRTVLGYLQMEYWITKSPIFLGEGGLNPSSCTGITCFRPDVQHICQWVRSEISGELLEFPELPVPTVFMEIFKFISWRNKNIVSFENLRMKTLIIIVDFLNNGYRLQQKICNVGNFALCITKLPINSVLERNKIYTYMLTLLAKAFTLIIPIQKFQNCHEIIFLSRVCIFALSPQIPSVKILDL